MANFGSPSVGFVLVGGIDLLPVDVLAVEDLSKESLLEVTHGLGKTDEESKATGVMKGAFGLTRYYDDGVNPFVGSEQTPQVGCLSWNGNVVGGKFTGFAGLFGAHARAIKRGELHKVKETYTVSGQVEEGIVLQELEAKTADWNTEGADSVDNGASSAGGGAGYLQVKAYTGFTNVVFKVRHSADDSTYVDLVTFTTVTAIGAQRVAVAGTVNRHLAADGNVTGSGSVTPMVGFSRAA